MTDSFGDREVTNGATGKRCRLSCVGRCGLLRKRLDVDLSGQWFSPTHGAMH